MPLPARMSRLMPLVALFLSGMVAAPSAQASGLPTECERAAASASLRHDVPLDVLLAIAHVETGRIIDGQMRPWPWALHALGKGQWFDTEGAALARARAVIASGTRNVDLGCFQVNYHWHGDRFPSLESMIAPASNADYAARFLRSHFNQLGDWESAAARYHSATPTLAERYLSRFRTARAMISQNALPQGTVLAQAHTPHIRADQRAPNSFILLQPAASGHLGSLVPQGAMSGGDGILLVDLARDDRP